MNRCTVTYPFPAAYGRWPLKTFYFIHLQAAQPTDTKRHVESHTEQMIINHLKVRQQCLIFQILCAALFNPHSDRCNSQLPISMARYLSLEFTLIPHILIVQWEIVLLAASVHYRHVVSMCAIESTNQIAFCCSCMFSVRYVRNSQSLAPGHLLAVVWFVVMILVLNGSRFSDWIYS